MSDDIVLDEPAEKKQPATKKPKQTTPVWAVLVVVLTFFGLVGSMTIQLLERNYYRGGSPSEKDPYAAQVVIPPTP